MEREKDIEAWLRRRIEDMGGMFLKFISLGNDGVPDRIAILPDGRVVFVELKVRRGKLAKPQEYQIDRMINMHQQVCVVYGMEGARAFLEDLKDYVICSAVYDWKGGCILEKVL